MIGANTLAGYPLAAENPATPGGDVYLPAITSAGAGTLARTGVGSINLPQFLVSEEGRGRVDLPALMVSGSGRAFDVLGAGNILLPGPLAAAGAGFRIGVADGEAALPAITARAQGSIRNIWPYKPMPESRETLQFSTDIMQTWSNETRVSRDSGRQSFSYIFRLPASKYWEAKSLIGSDVLREWLVPIWSEATRPVTVAAGATVLAVDTNADYRVGGKAVIWKGRAAYEVLTVAAVAPGSLTVSAPVASDFTRAAVMPAFTGVFLDGARFNSKPQGLVDVDIVFKRVDEDDIGAAVYDTFEGLDVLPCTTTKISGLAGGVSQSVDYVDNGFGPFSVETLRSVVDETFSLDIVDASPAERWKRKQFLSRVRGQDLPFWAPAWRGRLRLSAAVGSSDTQIQVAPLYAAALDNVGDRIAIIYNGATDYREITAAAATGGGDHLLTVAPLGRNVPATAIVKIIRKVRLAGDRVEIKHRHGLASTARLTVLEVPN